MKFNTGQLVVTRGVNDLMASSNTFANHVYVSVHRHAAGDWGDVCSEDRETNEFALQHSERLFSVYKGKKFATIWIITEWDRSITTVLLPEEY